MAGFQAVIGFPRFRSVGVPYTPPTPPSPPEGSPSAPQSLTALAAPNAVVLSWSFPSSTGTSSITKWNIYQGTVSGGETLLTGQSAQTQYGPNTYNCGAACTGLTAGDRYYFKVTAVNTAGEGGASNEVSAVAGAAVAMQAPDYFADNNMSEPIPFPNAVYSKPLSSTTPSYFPNGVPKAGNSSLLISNLESQYTNEGYGRP